MSKRILLTGGAGFIGHHTVEHILKNTDWEIVIIDRLSYAGNLNFLTDIEIWPAEKERVKFVYHDIVAPFNERHYPLLGKIDYIVHMAAESHVDRSIKNPYPFVYSNVLGTVNMLELAKVLKPQRFIYISTDEVYGPTSNGHLHTEGEPHRPSNPYSASKSAGEQFCYAYFNTYNMPIIITNTMNNFGERQHPEKFVPKTVKAILNKKPVTLHCKKDGKGRVTDVSSRCWLHARNHADAILFLLDRGTPGQSYNISGERATVEELAGMIAKALEMPPKIKYVDFHKFRPGHDMHYGLDSTKLHGLGWRQPFTLNDSLKKCVRWMADRREWLQE